jgi:hypothetical protein
VVNTSLHGYKNDQLTMYREITAVYSEVRTEHINTTSGKAVGFLGIKRNIQVYCKNKNSPRTAAQATALRKIVK